MALFMRVVLLASLLYLYSAQPVDEVARDEAANCNTRSAEPPQTAPSDGSSTQRKPWWWSLIAPRDQEVANRTRRSAESPQTGPSDGTSTQRKPWWWSLIAPRDQEVANRTRRSAESPQTGPSDGTITQKKPWWWSLIAPRDQELANRTRRSAESDDTHSKRRPHSVTIGWRDQAANRTTRSADSDDTHSKRRPHSVTIGWRDQAANRTRRSADSDDTHSKRRPHSVTIGWRDQAANRTRRSADSNDTHSKRRPHSVTIGWRDQQADPQHHSEEPDKNKKRHVTISWVDADGHDVNSSSHGHGHGDHLTITWPETPEENPNHQHHHDHTHHRREVLFRAGDSRPVELLCRGDDRHRPVSSYSWLKNKAVLNVTGNPDVLSSNADKSHLTLKAVDAIAGDYQCLTQTSLGTASSRVISVKKTYLTKPDSVATNKYTPTEGAPFSLPCAIPDGYPSPEVQWVSQDVNNPEKQKRIRNRRIVQSPDGTLWFSNVTREDLSGSFKYVCQAKTPAYEKPVALAEASIDSLQANSGANYSQLVEQYVSPDLVALAGGVTEIYCIYGGTPLAHPDWYKDGANVNGSPGGRVSRYNRSSGRRLVIHDTRSTDHGNYTCVADNVAGAPRSHSLTLTVEAKPRFTTRPPKEVQVKQGLDLTIQCQVSGIPAPDVTWTYNAQPLASSDRVTVGSQGVTIKEVQPSDKGYYGCLAINSHGNDYSESAVDVQ